MRPRFALASLGSVLLAGLILGAPARADDWVCGTVAPGPGFGEAIPKIRPFPAPRPGTPISVRVLRTDGDPPRSAARPVRNAVFTLLAPCRGPEQRPADPDAALNLHIGYSGGDHVVVRVGEDALNHPPLVACVQEAFARTRWSTPGRWKVTIRLRPHDPTSPAP